MTGQERKSSLLEFDRIQAVVVVALLCIGYLFIYSATMVGEPGLWHAYRDLSWGEFLHWLWSKPFFKQVIWTGVGLIVAAAAYLVDYRLLIRWGRVIYWFTIVALVLVLIPGIGAVRFGARRWIDLGPFQFQPSEFAKLAVVLALVDYLSCQKEELTKGAKLWKTMAMIFLPVVLIVIEPDLGSAVVIIPTAFAIMYVAEIPTRHLIKMIGAMALIATMFLVDVLFAPPNWQIKLQDYQRRRLLVYFGRPYPTPSGATPEQVRRLRRQWLDDTYNVRQALICIGSGGVMGKGWRQSTQIALGYLPRTIAHNDFIFSVLAEETGLVGSMMVLLLYGILFFTGLRTAARASDRLGRLLSVGIVTLLFAHVLINIGMNVRLLPVTGVPLPFLSYGGTSLVCSLIAAGLLQNVYVRRKGI